MSQSASIHVSFRLRRMRIGLAVSKALHWMFPYSSLGYDFAVWWADRFGSVEWRIGRGRWRRERIGIER